MKKASSNQSKKSPVVNLPLVHPNAAGIDIGDRLHSVAVPKGRDESQVRTFGFMTGEPIFPNGFPVHTREFFKKAESIESIFQRNCKNETTEEEIQ